MAQASDLRHIEDISDRLDLLTEELERTSKELADRLAAMKRRRDEAQNEPTA